MIVIIGKSAGKKKLNEELKKIKHSKVFNASKYSGKIIWNDDPVLYQRNLRDGWD